MASGIKTPERETAPSEREITPVETVERQAQRRGLGKADWVANPEALGDLTEVSPAMLASARKLRRRRARSKGSGQRFVLSASQRGSLPKARKRVVRWRARRVGT